MKVTPTDIPERADPRAQGVRRRARLLHRELQPARCSTRPSGCDVRVRAGQPLALGAGRAARPALPDPPQPQGKLVRVAQGAVFDVAVDIRRAVADASAAGSGVELSAGEPAAALDPAGLRARLPGAERKRRLSLQDHRLLRPAAPSAASAGTTRPWASTGRSPAKRLRFRTRMRAVMPGLKYSGEADSLT